MPSLLSLFLITRFVLLKIWSLLLQSKKRHIFEIDKLAGKNEIIEPLKSPPSSDLEISTDTRQGKTI